MDKPKRREVENEVLTAFGPDAGMAVIRVARRERFDLRKFAMWVIANVDDENYTEVGIVAKVREKMTLDHCRDQLARWWIDVGFRALKQREQEVWCKAVPK